MSFMDSIKTCFGKYATFAGRASRSEFWWFMLFLLVSTVVLSFVDTVVFGPRDVMTMATTDSFEQGMSFNFSWNPQPITAVFMLVTLLPNISVMVRRLHDTGRSGGWWFIGLIPMIGLIVLIIFTASKGTDGDNAYGPDPLA